MVGALKSLKIPFINVLFKYRKQDLEVPKPAIGDIRLVPYSDPRSNLMGYYEVLVYYTDGIEKPSWGSICGGLSEKVGTVICRQLGYDFDHITSVYVYRREAGS